MNVASFGLMSPIMLMSSARAVAAETLTSKIGFVYVRFILFNAFLEKKPKFHYLSMKTLLMHRLRWLIMFASIQHLYSSLSALKNAVET
jgi:hypothetical protein